MYFSKSSVAITPLRCGLAMGRADAWSELEMIAAYFAGLEVSRMRKMSKDQQHQEVEPLYLQHVAKLRQEHSEYEHMETITRKGIAIMAQYKAIKSAIVGNFLADLQQRVASGGEIPTSGKQLVDLELDMKKAYYARMQSAKLRLASQAAKRATKLGVGRLYKLMDVVGTGKARADVANPLEVVDDDLIRHGRKPLLPSVARGPRGRTSVPRDVHDVHAAHASREAHLLEDGHDGVQLRSLGRHVDVLLEGAPDELARPLVRELAQHWDGDATRRRLPDELESAYSVGPHFGTTTNTDQIVCSAKSPST